MIVYNFQNFYAGDLNPDALPVIVHRNGIFVWLENQPVGLIQITGPLAFTIIFQLMITTRQITYILKGFSSLQLRQPQPQFICSDLPEGLIQPSIVSYQFSKFPVCKCDIHYKGIFLG